MLPVQKSQQLIQPLVLADTIRLVLGLVSSGSAELDSSSHLFLIGLPILTSYVTILLKQLSITMSH